MTVGTKLDFNAKTLSFCWEGKPYELAYQDINTMCDCVSGILSRFDYSHPHVSHLITQVALVFLCHHGAPRQDGLVVIVQGPHAEKLQGHGHVDY